MPMVTDEPRGRMALAEPHFNKEPLMRLLYRRSALRILAGAPVAAGLLWTQPAAAATPTYTTLVVTNLHCSACAKKVARKLYALSHVKEVRADVKKNTAYVVPERGKSVSPKAMWEAVEAAGFKMVRLSGPGGSFETKPRS